MMFNPSGIRSPHMRRSLLISQFRRSRAWATICALLLMVATLGTSALSVTHRSTHVDSAPLVLAGGASHEDPFGHDEGSAGCTAFDAMLTAVQTPPPSVVLADAVFFGGAEIVIPLARAYVVQTRGAQRARAPPRESLLPV